MNSADSPHALQAPQRLRRYVGPQEVIRIDCEVKCNVLVVDDENYRQYSLLRPYRYTGGFYSRFPVWVKPPYPGDWNVVVDLGGADPSTRYAIMVVSDPQDLDPSMISSVIESSESS